MMVKDQAHVHVHVGGHWWVMDIDTDTDTDIDTDTDMDMDLDTDLGMDTVMDMITDGHKKKKAAHKSFWNNSPTLLNLPYLCKKNDKN